MSSNEFFGRPISGSSNIEFQFDLCEICQRKSPNWLEIQYQDEIPLIRFTCNDCHETYITSVSPKNQENIREFDPDVEVVDTVRPGWVDEFLTESSSNLETIETTPISETNITESDENVEIEFSEAPASFSYSEDQQEYSTDTPSRLAVWAPKFIEQALFGSNPEEWLYDQGGYKQEQVDLTLMTLGNFASNDISTVKLTAIQCLLELYNRDKTQKEKVLQQLVNFQIDTDLTVSEFASQTIQQIK